MRIRDLDPLGVSTDEQMAERLGLSATTIERYVRAGKFKGFRIDGHLFIPHAPFIAWWWDGYSVNPHSRHFRGDDDTFRDWLAEQTGVRL